MRASVESALYESASTLGNLADAERYHEPISIDTADISALMTGLERMILIRVVEEKIGDMVSQGIVKCPCHLAVVRLEQARNRPPIRH